MFIPAIALRGEEMGTALCSEWVYVPTVGLYSDKQGYVPEKGSMFRISEASGFGAVSPCKRNAQSDVTLCLPKLAFYRCIERTTPE